MAAGSRRTPQEHITMMVMIYKLERLGKEQLLRSAAPIPQHTKDAGKGSIGQRIIG